MPGVTEIVKKAFAISAIFFTYCVIRHMFTIPNQSSVPMAYKEFDDAGRMRPSGYYDRVVDVMEELYKMTLLLRGRTDYLTDRYSERNERARQAIDRQIEKI